MFYLVYRFRKLAASKQKQVLYSLAMLLLIGLLVIMVLTGRLNWLIAAIGALLPLIPRMIRFFMGVWPSVMPYFQRYQQNRQSNMQSRFIRLQIDMLTGELQGEVLEGSFAGQKLHTMSREQLLVLLDQCKQHDSESAALLVAYLDRMHAGWTKGERASYESAASDSTMGDQQARDILGVSESANRKEIIKAHKRLMQKLHPDRGGSDYLAQQINKARDTLLKNV